MFELFTERARRVIFFGRYEASQTGSTTIETEHLLLGLIRENVNLFDKVPSVKTFRDEVFPTPYGPPVSTSIDLPLSLSARRVLQSADKEHQALGDPSIATGHLLLGILSEVDSPSAKILAKYGVTRDTVIEKMKREPEGGETIPTRPVDSLVHRPLYPSIVRREDDTTVVESIHTHDRHSFKTITRYRTSSDGKKVNVTLQIRGPSGVQEFETEFDIPPATTGTDT
jgi:ATP-dependent Clp protease ATP-binding subunit ClpA